MPSRTRVQVISLSADRAVEKVARAGIPVFRAVKSQKNAIEFEVPSKDLEKVFAILQNSCYNVNKTEKIGWGGLLQKRLRHAGLFAGILLFCLIVLFAQTRVLKIEVSGNGEFYEGKVCEILKKSGVSFFSAEPENPASITAEILALPRVSYCSLNLRGGVLRVEVRVSEEQEAKEFVPLLAPVSGTLEELVVVRGTANAAVGDRVEEGQQLVLPFCLMGESERETIVIARAVISYEAYAVFGGTEEEALLQAYLQYGEIRNLHIEKSDGGIAISGTAFCVCAINLG